MFLVDSAQAAADWDGTMGVIHTVLERAGAEIVMLKKWAEKKLAYDINHKERGTYILTYFKADGARISGMENDVRLSEKIMRVLILSADERPQDCIDRDLSQEHVVSSEEPVVDRISEPEETEEISGELDEAEGLDDGDSAEGTDWPEGSRES